MTDSDRRVLEYPARSRDIQRPTGEHDRRSGSGRRLLGFGALLLLGGLALASGSITRGTSRSRLPQSSIAISSRASASKRCGRAPAR